MKNSDIGGVVEYVKKEIPADVIAESLREHFEGRDVSVRMEDFIISNSKRRGYIRIIRDIKMLAAPVICGEENSCRMIFMYELINNDVFNYRRKSIYE